MKLVILLLVALDMIGLLSIGLFHERTTTAAVQTECSQTVEADGLKGRARVVAIAPCKRPKG